MKYEALVRYRLKQVQNQAAANWLGRQITQGMSVVEAMKLSLILGCKIEIGRWPNHG